VNDWLDHDYIEKYTLGWDALRERAMTWTLSRAAEVCGIDESLIRELAKDWGTTKKAAIRLNYGMQRVKGGRQCRQGCSVLASANRCLARPRGRHAAQQFKQFQSEQSRFASARFIGLALVLEL
jgi:anaerobic selenocysteine-containing dehydrogenase